MYNYMQRLANHGFTFTDQLSDAIQAVNGNDRLFFRIGDWGENADLVSVDALEGKGLICQQDLVALGKHLEKSEIQPTNCLQVISGRVFNEKAIISPVKMGERFVHQPEIVLEFDVPVITELRDNYIDILENGGFTEKPEVPHVISEDFEDSSEYSEPKPLSIEAIMGKEYLKKLDMRKAFSTNWDNLVARDAYMKENGSLTEKPADRAFADKHPLSDNFKVWAQKNFSLITVLLNSDSTLGTVHERGSELNDINRRIARSNRHIDEMGLFPENREPGITVEPGEYHPPMSEIIKRIDAKIAEYNPRASKYSEPEVDEHGEYIEYPELIGDFENPQFAGVDEHGDDTYTDFDQDGVFLPMGNPNNATDYQDDFDPDELQSQSWQSIDGFDDHHYQESLYKEVGITETPHFTEEGGIEWVNQPHAESSPIVERHTDTDFMTDARNYLQRGRLIEAAESGAILTDILTAYPVSEQFTSYIEEQGIDWETTSQRLTEFLESGEISE